MKSYQIEEDCGCNQTSTIENCLQKNLHYTFKVTEIPDQTEIIKNLEQEIFELKRLRFMNEGTH